MERIIIVCGGRDYGDKQHVSETLDSLHANVPVRLMIEGGADGADKWARVWADRRGVPHLTVEALWGKYGRRAGPIRNRGMLCAQPDLVVAFPGGPGTADMVSASREAGCDVIEVPPRVLDSLPHR